MLRSSGVKTYGTGTVLGEFPLADGSALRVGTVEWLTPKGRRDLARGDRPRTSSSTARRTSPRSDPDDIKSMTAAQIATLTDPQLARALTVASAAATPPA